MKDLGLYIKESLLDDFDDLEKEADTAVENTLLKGHLKIMRMDCCGMRVKDLTGLREIKKYVKKRETEKFEVLSKRYVYSSGANSTMKPSALECLFVDYVLNQYDPELLEITHTGYMDVDTKKPKVIQALEELIGPGYKYNVYRSISMDKHFFHIAIEIFDYQRARYVKLKFNGSK